MRLLGGAILAVLSVSAVAQRSPLTLRVFTTAPGSLNTNVVLISGERDAVLVDVPLLRSDAYRLVGDILDSGKELTKIVITHAHPDHYFGADVLKQAFPEAEVVAAPEVVDEIWRSFPDRIDFWAPRLGRNAPRLAALPVALEQSVIAIEGYTVEVLGPMQGDAPLATAIYVPDLRALVAGDIVFNQVHIGSGRQSTRQRAAWIASLESLLLLDPIVVVAGHTSPGLPNTQAAIEFTIDYLQRFEQAIDEADSPQALVNIMREAFPDALDIHDDLTLSSTENATFRLNEN